jgi:hypothetical protein
MHPPEMRRNDFDVLTNLGVSPEMGRNRGP